MRIRKHAKISPLLYASSATLIQTHLCQLNQSPWDVITFPPPDPSVLPPPPPFLVDKDYTYWTNGTSEDHIAADVSPAIDNGGNGSGPDQFEQHKPLKRLKKEGEDTICCCKIDGKGWQCSRKARNGQSFCELHLSQAKNSAKKSESSRGVRPKKPAAPSSNPYEFYYYSGFGPRWGKRRGLAPAAAAAIKLEEEGEEQPYSSTENSSDTSSKTSNNNIAHEGPITPEPNVKHSSSSSYQVDKQGIDHVEDEDDDDDDEEDNGERGRKKARKPIKARSLKSLM